MEDGSIRSLTPGARRQPQTPGDAMMRRFRSDEADKAAPGGKGEMHITLEGFPQKTRVKTKMDDLFTDTTVSRLKSVQSANMA